MCELVSLTSPVPAGGARELLIKDVPGQIQHRGRVVKRLSNGAEPVQAVPCTVSQRQTRGIKNRRGAVKGPSNGGGAVQALPCTVNRRQNRGNKEPQ